MKHRPFDTFFHWMTLSALFAVALSQFRLVNDLRTIHASGPEFHAQMPPKLETTHDDRVKDVLEEQARINRQMLQVLQTMKSQIHSEKVPSVGSAPDQQEPPKQAQLPEPDLTMENGPFDRSGFENQTDEDLVAMNRDLLREY